MRLIFDKLMVVDLIRTIIARKDFYVMATKGKTGQRELGTLGGLEAGYETQANLIVFFVVINAPLIKML